MLRTASAEGDLPQLLKTQLDGGGATGSRRGPHALAAPGTANFSRALAHSTLLALAMLAFARWEAKMGAWPIAAFALAAPLSLATDRSLGSRIRRTRVGSPARDMAGIVGASAVAAFLMAAADAAIWHQPIQGSGVVRLWSLLAALELGGRSAWRAYRQGQVDLRPFPLRTLVIGTGDEACATAASLGGNPRFHPLGYVATAAGAQAPNGLPVLGALADLDHLIKGHRADCLILSGSGVASEEAFEAVQAGLRGGIQVQAASEAGIRKGNDGTAQPLNTGPAQELVKRALDLVVASALLLASAPILLAAAVAVARSSAGPVLFRQKRVTKGGRVFEVFKFRTMVAAPAGTAEESTPFFKCREDPRLTRVGHFLRRFSIDELPQLFNVLKGEMSMVGPRPLPVPQVAANWELLGPRHEVQAGLTGWWQVNGRSDVDAEAAVEMDRYYIDHRSLRLDLVIMMKTAAVLVSRRGAY